MAKDDDDEIILPKKSKTKASALKTAPRETASPPMRRLMRITRVIGMTLGGFVAVVGVMSVAGLASSNLWFRLAVGVLLVLALPAIVSDRMLKRTNANLGTRGALGMVGDVFAITVLGIAIAFVAGESVTRNLLEHEGDHYARASSNLMARAVYFIAGVSPVFPSEKPARPAGSASASSSAAAPPPR